MRKVDFTSYKTNQDSDIVSAIKANDNDVLKSIYTTNYHKIETLVIKNNGTKDHAKDIYQEAFLALWKNVKLDKFSPKNESSIHGYLYTIAKNKWMDYLRSNNYKKIIVSDQINDLNASKVDNGKIDDDILNEKRLSYVMQAFRNIGEPCKSLLRQFYFDKKSMKDIASELQLDAASTRNKKYRCMQKLREIALKFDT